MLEVVTLSIPYDDSFAHELFSTWEAIATEWNDKKSHEINDKYIHVLQRACNDLVDLAHDTQIEINCIVDECDAIY